MLTDITANADVRGARIDVDLTWRAEGSRPALRLMRRTLGYPEGAEDGVVVFDLADLFSDSHTPWGRIDWIVHSIPEGPMEGLVRAAEEMRFYAPDQSKPSRISIRPHFLSPAALKPSVRMPPKSGRWEPIHTLKLYERRGGGRAAYAGRLVLSLNHDQRLSPIRIRATPNEPKWFDFDLTDPTHSAGKTLAIELFSKRAGQKETSAGRFLLSPDDEKEPAAIQFRLQTGQEETDVSLTSVETLRIRGEILPAAVNMQRSAFEVFREFVRKGKPALIPSSNIGLDESFDPNSGEWTRRVHVRDEGLAPENTYYYKLFQPIAERPGQYRTQSSWQASATPTGRYGLGDRLYDALTAVHKRFDEPTGGQHGDGQLRQFLGIFGVVLDHVRSLAESLGNRHDVLTVAAERLPYLARTIGWETDRTLTTREQRQEILFAPEIYKTVGTIPGIRALVNWFTGWDCEIKEFAHNVFLSNAPETNHLWEIWTCRFNAEEGSWNDPPLPLSPREAPRFDGFDGRPTAVVNQDGLSTLFWHSNRADADAKGPRRIWMQRLESDEETRKPSVALPAPPHGGPFIDEYPAAVIASDEVWLFWDSNRSGSWDIWYKDPGLGKPKRLFAVDKDEHQFAHDYEDRCPAAVLDKEKHIWVFWQSNRRGPTDIWCCRSDGEHWEPPRRLTTAIYHDTTPTAVVDNTGRIWVFWSADLGDRQQLFLRVLDNTGRVLNESQITQVVAETDPNAGKESQGRFRDEAPAAVTWKGNTWLFWHSNRTGRWQIYAQPWVWGDNEQRPRAAEPRPVSLSFDPRYPSADKEPWALADGQDSLRILWRSQRRGEHFKSRTLDVNDHHLLGGMGRQEDQTHYTHTPPPPVMAGRSPSDDTGTDAKYAQGTIAIYITPDVEDEALVQRKRLTLKAALAPFLPVNVRPIFIIKRAPYTEHIYTYDFPEAKEQRFIGEEVFDQTLPESYFGLYDTYADRVPEWIWIRSWSEGHPDHRTVALETQPDGKTVVHNTQYRTWHIGLTAGG